MENFYISLERIWKRDILKTAFKSCETQVEKSIDLLVKKRRVSKLQKISETTREFT